jgi:Tol biopolymer transport system component
LSWLPDSSALWAAIPDAQSGDVDHPVLDLYRISLNGQAQRAGQIQAMETVWSPDGRHLAYTGTVDNGTYGRQLFVANADGSNARVYGNAIAGTITSWSPDSQHFLYTSNGQTYIGTLGAPDQQPQSLGAILQPFWIDAGQVLALTNQGDSWALVSYKVDGQAATLAQLPQGSLVLDVTRR